MGFFFFFFFFVLHKRPLVNTIIIIKCCNYDTLVRDLEEESIYGGKHALKVHTPFPRAELNLSWPALS